MVLKDISFPTLAENVAFDEILFQLADKQGQEEYLRFWESPVYGVVLGRISKMEEDVRLASTETDGIAVLRRSSGGGTVLQGPGCLNFTLVLCKQKRPVLNDLHASYEWILTQVAETLRPLGIEAVFHPISDLALAENARKFSGNAQRRGKTHILHHGTILYKFSLDFISRYLTMPKETPVYRKGRSHNEFVANIPIAPQVFKPALAARLGVLGPPQDPTPEEIAFLKNYLK